MEIIGFLILISFTAITLQETRIIQISSVLMFLSFMVYSIYELFWGKFSHKISIDEKGIRYIKHKETFDMEWKEVDSISISAQRYGAVNKFSMICFEMEVYQKYDVSGVKEYDADKVTTYDSNFFCVQYREVIIKEIQKYWDQRIWGLYRVTGKERL